jgi:hypothetical protein
MADTPKPGITWDQLDRLITGRASAGDIRAEIDEHAALTTDTEEE